MLSKSWFFRLSTFAFIVLITPALGVYLHAPGGILILLYLSVMVGLIEGSFTPVLRRIFLGIVKNKLLVIFSIWYFIGVIVDYFVTGNGLDDWRLMMSPIILFVGILYAFAFMSDASCGRFLQIGIILALGIQSIFTIPQIYNNPEIARVMWFELSGKWLYGDPGYFSTCIILLPVLLWRSFKEKGILKLGLLTCSSLILFTASISSFGTPLGLVIISIIITSSLSIIFMAKKKGWIIAIIIILISYYGYHFSISNTLFSVSYTRIENFINNPTSGGYSGQDLQYSRWKLDQISSNSFWENPIFGTGRGSTHENQYLGGHSSLLDSLGAYGILGGGGAFVGLMLILLFNVVKRFLDKRNWQSLLILVTVISLMIGGIINPYWNGWQPIFVILIARPFIGSINNIAPLRQMFNNASSTSYRYHA